MSRKYSVCLIARHSTWTAAADCLCCMQSGYPCLSLHGGKDQSDRESTIADFKSDVCNVLIATSVAARGLDVKDLVCHLSPLHMRHTQLKDASMHSCQTLPSSPFCTGLSGGMRTGQ